MKTEEHMKQLYADQLEALLGNKSQKEKEETLSGEKYALKKHLTQTIEQVARIQKRINVLEKFTIVKDKLAFEGVVLSPNSEEEKLK